jgi:hypothetical protein
MESPRQHAIVGDYRSENEIDFPAILKDHGCVSSVTAPVNTDEGPSAFSKPLCSPYRSLNTETM